MHIADHACLVHPCTSQIISIQTKYVCIIYAINRPSLDHELLDCVLRASTTQLTSKSSVKVELTC